MWKTYWSTFRLRFHFAYRHSFRSGSGVKDFIECWKFSKEIFGGI